MYVCMYLWNWVKVDVNDLIEISSYHLHQESEGEKEHYLIVLKTHEHVNADDT